MEGIYPNAMRNLPGNWTFQSPRGTTLRRVLAHQALVRKASGGRLPHWAIPLAYAVVAVLLGATLPRIETHWLPELVAPVSTSSAMAIDSSIASGMIALTGIVFSLAFVMVQFGATAYSPRLVSWIARDPFLMHAIGVFTATFLYAVAALLWIDRNRSGKVPCISAWLVVGLLLASVALFVCLVQRLSRLQVQSILVFAAECGRRVIDTFYPPLGLGPHPFVAAEFERLPITQTLVDHGRPRAIQALDTSALLAAACDSGGVVEMSSAVGDTVAEGRVLLRVYGARRPISERLLRKAIITGERRTFQQDPKYAIHLLSDIAIRALSPAVNDPSTAVQALDQIQDLLLRLGRRRLEVGALRDDDGKLRLAIPVPTWEDFLTLALEEIRHYGSGDVQVMRRMRALLGDLLEELPAERRPALHAQLERLETVISRVFEDEEEVLVASMEDHQGLGAPRKRLRR